MVANLKSVRSGSELPAKVWPDAADLNIRLLRALAACLSDHHGLATLSEVAARAGLRPEDFDGRVKWISADQFDEFLLAARAVIPDEASFRAALVHRNAELSFGPLRYVLWATSPLQIFQLGCKNMRVVSAISQYEITGSGRNFISARYKSTKKESRENCLLRQESGRALPTLWGLPAAELIEGGCIAHGDPCCEYTYRWRDRRAPLPLVVGLLLGALFGYALGFVGLGSPVATIAAAIVGVLIGIVWDLTQRMRGSHELGDQIQRALQTVANEDAKSRLEILELTRRQREWTSLMEEQISERTAAAQQVATQLKSLLDWRIHGLRGISHDMRSPLVVLRANLDYLQATLPEQDREMRECFSDQERALEMIQTLLSTLMKSVLSETELIKLRPERVEVPTLVERLRRTLNALLYGRDIKGTVFSTREAPEWIAVDNVLFNRVTDNLLTNAAKYTERGSIVVELAGSPGFLTIKVSDTGRGISPEAIEHIFEPGGSAVETRAPASFGVGLSVVAQLLWQIGGRMEVMSKPGSGTTFWVHFPKESSATEPDDQSLSSTPRDIVRRVVKIRRI